MNRRLETGVPGLDTVLDGGLWPGSCVLVNGAAGTGKTTLGLQFLFSGALAGQGGAYITFEQFPDQIYRDARQFGWDLPALERAGKLQVICISPEAFLSEAVETDGLLEELKHDLKLGRVVIDSLNLLLMDQPEANWRKSFYRLRNALQRLSVTSLFLHELYPETASQQVPEFVADTVMSLTYDRFEEHRLRHLEILKHRGSDFVPGRHIFVFNGSGLKVLPLLSRIPDPMNRVCVPTGLERLDLALGSGLIRGSSVVMNVNSKGHYRYLLASVIAAHIKQGYRWLCGPSGIGLNEVEQLVRLYDIDLVGLGAEGTWEAVEVKGRYIPPNLTSHVRTYSKGAGHSSAIATLLLESATEQRPLLVTIDMNVVLRHSGAEAMEQEWMKLIAATRENGHTLIAVCNFDEMGAAFTSFVQRTANSIFRLWFDGRYQYLQVLKSPAGRVSPPMVIEYKPQPPFMEVW